MFIIMLLDKIILRNAFYGNSQKYQHSHEYIYYNTYMKTVLKKEHSKTQNKFILIVKYLLFIYSETIYLYMYLL